MKLLDEILEQYNSSIELPEGCKIWIAGGAPRDCLLGRNPKDIDVYIFTDCDEDTKFIQERIESACRLGLIETAGHTPITYGSTGLPVIYPIATFMMDGFVVQTMISKYDTIKELLDSFDWNICKLAYNQQEGLYDPGNLSDILMAPKDYSHCLYLTKITNPFSNLRRGYRFSERYGFTLRTNDIQTLCLAIVDKLKNDPGGYRSPEDSPDHKKIRRTEVELE